MSDRRRVSSASRASRPLIDGLESRTYFAISLGEPQFYPLGNISSSAAAIADFNGDGFPDVASTTGGDAVSVSLNDTRGGYLPAFALSVSTKPFQVIAADFNGDAKADLAAADPVDNTVSVLLGVGDGTFAAPIRNAFGDAAPAMRDAVSYLAAADLDADGKMDLVVEDYFDNRLLTLRGNGDGSFSKASTTTIGGTAAGPLAVADFNGDGKADVATNLWTDAQLYLFFGDGAGGLDDGRAIPIETVPYFAAAEGIATGDFNGDAKIDIAMVSAPLEPADPSLLSIFLNQGGGNFLNGSASQVGVGVKDVAAADVDGDGKLDVVVSGAGGLQAFSGNGDGTFSAEPTFASPVAGPAAVADVDKDAKLDLIVSRSSPNPALAVLRTGGGTAGGNSGGGDDGLPPVIVPTLAASLPTASVLTGSKLRGATVTVSLTNDGADEMNAKVTVELFLSTDGGIDAGDAALGTPVVKKIRLKPTKSKAVKLKLPVLPMVSDGTYYLLSRTTPEDAVSGVAAAASTLKIAAPFTDLTGAFTDDVPTMMTPGKKTIVHVTVRNDGNVDAAGKIEIRLTGHAASGTEVALPTTTVPLKLRPGATRTIKLAFKVPTSAAAETYTLLGTLDATGALPAEVADNNQLSSATPFVIGG